MIAQLRRIAGSELQRPAARGCRGRLVSVAMLDAPIVCAVHGVFDYGDACLADRHRDFRDLVFDVGADEPLEAAVAVYEPATGVRIDRARVLLENAGCALSFLAERRGHAPEARPCGRTLAEDLRWVRAALARVT